MLTGILVMAAPVGVSILLENFIAGERLLAL
jgi:hypothetical protein